MEGTRQKGRAGSSLLTVLVVLAFLASGCTFWRNFSTYFNTLYLAQQHLDIYEEQMNQQPVAANAQQAALAHRWLDEEYDMRQLAGKTGPTPKIQATFLRNKLTVKGTGSNVHLDSAIILGSKILANKKETKYVEDALFIVGKAQFYKNDYNGAKRKFLELLTKYPNTKYGSAVQMLLARSMLGSGGLDTAETALRTAVKQAEADHDTHTLGDAHRTLAEIIFAKNPDSLEAVATELHRSTAFYQPDEAARVEYEAGIVQYLNGDWMGADSSFAHTVAMTKDASFEGEARINRALALRRLGKFDDAKAELTRVCDKAKYSLDWPAGRYELAYTTDLASRAAVANNLRSDSYRQQYYPAVKQGYFVVDTAYKRESSSIVSRSNFRQAEIFRGMGEYDSASKLAMPLIGTKDFSTLMMNDYVSDRMRALANFSKWNNELTMLDSVDHQIKSGNRLGPDAAKHGDEALHQKALQEFYGARWNTGAPPQPTVEEVPKIALIEAQLRKTQKSPWPQIGNRDTLRFIDSIHYRIANDHFELGMSYEKFDEINTARNEYKTALQYTHVRPDTVGDIFKAEVVYTWLQLEAGEKNIPVRDSLLALLTKEYSQTIYARQAFTLYGGPRDTNSPGEVAYRAAWRTLRSSGLDASKPSFLSVVNGYIREDVAPRSLFAVGVTYEEATRYDSAVFYYKRVLNEYPYSSYAEALRPRLPDVAAASKGQLSTARRLDGVQSQSEKELQEAERMRQQSQQQLLQQQQQNQNPNLTPPTLNPGQDSTGTNNPGDVPPPPPPPPPGGSSTPFSRPQMPVKRP